MTNNPWQALAPGANWRGWWQPPDSELATMPVLAVRGLHDGPTVLLTGAVHGDEYEGPAAIHHTFRTLDASQLHGRVIGLPVVNMAAYRHRSRTTPADSIDLNRTFPGNPDAQSSLSYRLAHLVFSTFVHPCDILIDLHSGGAKLRHLPMVGWYAGNAAAEQMARSFHAAVHPWLIPVREGVLSSEADRAGKMAIGAEWGGGAQLDSNGVAAYTIGVERILRSFDPHSAIPSVVDRRAPIAGTYQEVTQGGLFLPAVALGDQVNFGDPLGMLYDELGNEIASVVAERAGLVAALAHNALLDTGDRVAYLG